MRKSEKKLIQIVVMLQHQTKTARRAPSLTLTDARKISGQTEHGVFE